MKGKGARIYRHQSVFGPGCRYGSTNYNNQIRNDVFYDGDIKPVIKIRKGKARIVGHKRVKSWRKRDHIATNGHTNSAENISNRLEAYNPSYYSGSSFSRGYTPRSGYNGSSFRPEETRNGRDYLWLR